jgi:flagellar FliJ protein
MVALRESELRCASVRKLIERRTQEHRLFEERRDQKQTDEQAARAAWNRLGANGGSRLM